MALIGDGPSGLRCLINPVISQMQSETGHAAKAICEPSSEMESGLFAGAVVLLITLIAAWIFRVIQNRMRWRAEAHGWDDAQYYQYGHSQHSGEPGR